MTCSYSRRCLRVSRHAILGMVLGLALFGAAADAATLTFTVNTSRDTGYSAENTLAGSRLNTKLRDTASSVAVFTKEFLTDIGYERHLHDGGAVLAGDLALGQGRVDGEVLVGVSEVARSRHQHRDFRLRRGGPQEEGDVVFGLAAPQPQRVHAALQVLDFPLEGRTPAAVDDGVQANAERHRGPRVDAARA